LHVTEIPISDDQVGAFKRLIECLLPARRPKIDCGEIAEGVLEQCSRINVVVDIHDLSVLIDGRALCAHPFGNLTSIAAANSADGLANRISAPYSSRMLRVIVRPNPIPCPRLASTLAVVVRNGSNQRSDVSSFTAFPVFSILNERAPSACS